MTLALIRDLRAGPPHLDPVRLPFMLRMGMRVSAFIGLLWIALLPLAALNIGQYEIDDRTVSGVYFLTHADAFMLPMVAVLLAVAYGIRTVRLWARPLMVAFWLVGLVAFAALDLLSREAMSGGDIVALGELLFFAAVANWYLYAKPNVVSYYRALAAYNHAPTRSQDQTATISSPGV